MKSVLTSLLIAIVAMWSTPAVAHAEPEPAPIVSDEVAPPPDAMAPGNTSYLRTPDGWELEVKAVDETIHAVNPLTTALSSREYVVGGTFMGEIRGSGTTTIKGGSFETGYRIGCGLTTNITDIGISANINPSLSFANGPDLSLPGVNGWVRVTAKTGIVNDVRVTTKQFKGTSAKVEVSGMRINIDGCVGQSFIQSYAKFAASTADTEDITTYLGTVKVV